MPMEEVWAEDGQGQPMPQSLLPVHNATGCPVRKQVHILQYGISMMVAICLVKQFKTLPLHFLYIAIQIGLRKSIALFFFYNVPKGKWKYIIAHII